MSKKPGTWCSLVLLVWTCASASTLPAQNPAELRYTVSLADNQNHLVRVQMELPSGAREVGRARDQIARQVGVGSRRDSGRGDCGVRNCRRASWALWRASQREP